MKKVTKKMAIHAEPITLDVQFATQEYTETPGAIRLTFSESDIQAIEQARRILQEHKEFICIDIPAPENAIFLQDGAYGEICDDWDSGDLRIHVYAQRMYVYDQNRYDATDQIESEGFVIE